MSTVTFPHRPSVPAAGQKGPTDVLLIDDTNNDKLLLDDATADELQLQDA